MAVLGWDRAHFEDHRDLGMKRRGALRALVLPVANTRR